MHGACTKRPYFHFRSKTWRHHRVHRLPFSIRRENFGNLRTFTSYLHGVSGPFGLKWGFGGNIREGVVRYWSPNKLVFTFGGFYVCANSGENRSRIATVRVLADGYTHYTDTLTDRRKPIFSERERDHQLLRKKQSVSPKKILATAMPVVGCTYWRVVTHSCLIFWSLSAMNSCNPGVLNRSFVVGDNNAADV